MLRFLRRNWIATLAFFAAASLVTAVSFSPAIVAAVAGFSLGSTAPFAFLASFSPMAAALMMGSTVLGLGLVFNAVAALFRAPEPAARRLGCGLEAVTIDDEADDLGLDEDAIEAAELAAVDATAATPAAPVSPASAAKRLGMFAQAATAAAADEAPAATVAPAM